MAGQDLSDLFDDINPPPEAERPPVLPGRSLFEDLNPPPLSNQQKTQAFIDESYPAQVIGNLPGRDVMGRAATSALFGIPDMLLWAAHQSRRAGLTPDQFKNLQQPTYLTPTVQEFLNIAPMPEDASTAQKIGEGLLTSVVGGPRPRVSLQRQAPLPAGVREPARTLTGRLAPVAGEVASATGGVLGEQAGQALGGDIGAVLGGLAGGMTPAVANRIAGITNRSFLAAPDSAERVQILDNLGIPLSPGLVGNRGAGRVENTAASLPVVGRVAQGVQRRQLDAFQGATYDDMGRLRGVPFEAPYEIPTAGGIGGDMRNAADQALEDLRARRSEGYDEFFSRPGVEDVVVPPVQTRQYVYGPEVQGRESGPTIRSLEQGLREDIDPYATRAYDPNLVGPTNQSTLRGMPIEQFRRARSDVGADTRQGQGLLPGAKSQMYQAMTPDIEREIMNHPAMQRAFPDPADRAAQLERLRVLDAEYRRTEADTGSRYEGRDVETLEQFGTRGNNESVFSFGQAPDVMDTLSRNMPQGSPQFGDIAAQTILHNASVKAPIEGINISPQKLAQWWDTMPREAQVAMVGGDMRAFVAMRDLAEAGRIFRGRATTINASQTAPTLATMGVMGNLIARPVETLGTLGSGMAIASLAASEPFARQLARTDPEWNRILTRRAANAAMMQGGRMDKAGPR